MTTHTQVILVDQNDQSLGTANKLIAHQQGLLHRAFSIFIFRSHQNHLQLLLQQRQKDKYHSNNLWTNTCCSHPKPEEKNIIIAGKRRLAEEMGLHISLTYAGNFIYNLPVGNGLVEHEYDHVLIGTYNNESIDINPNEVADFQWLRVQQMMQDLTERPQLYTSWLPQALAIALQAYTRKYEK